jgi:hypothetical protein
MKSLSFLFFTVFFLASISFSQTYKIQEGFENNDSTSLPTGWAKWNTASFRIGTDTNWTVRDTGVGLPGLASATSKAHTGLKSCGVSWLSGTDTAGGYHIAAAWLVTKKVHVQTGDQLKFWASGGSPSYGDSIQVWVNIDSIPPMYLGDKLATIVWPHGSQYGVFTQYVYSLNAYNGLDIWIGFDYCTDQTVSTNGFFVFLDDVEVVNPIGIKKIESNIPKTFNLYQNYPNPFNPTTTFQFDLPRKEFVNIVLYNTLGQQLKTLLNEQKDAGSYKVDFDGSDLASGTYFYKITAGDFVKTNRMVLVK